MVKPKDESEVAQTDAAQTEEPKTELTTKERLDKMLADKQSAATKAVEAAAKQAEEADKLAEIDIDSDVEGIIDDIKKIDDDTAVVKAKMVAEIEPLNKQITEIKAKPEYKTDEAVKARKEKYDVLVEKIGETAAKLLCGGVGKSAGTGNTAGRSGKLNGKSVRETVADMYLDEGMIDFELLASTMKERFPEAKVYGNNEKINGGTAKNGNLMKRHMDEMVTKAGTVVKNDDGTYSKA